MKRLGGSGRKKLKKRKKSGYIKKMNFRKFFNNNWKKGRKIWKLLEINRKNLTDKKRRIWKDYILCRSYSRIKKRDYWIWRIKRDQLKSSKGRKRLNLGWKLKEFQKLKKINKFKESPWWLKLREKIRNIWGK